jgi:beta-glucosidase
MRLHALRRGLVLGALLASVAALSGHAASARSTASCPWMNTALSPADRAHMLVAAMTLDQKISMVVGTGYPGTGPGKGAGSVGAIPELCVPRLGLADGAGGLGNGNTGVTAWPAPIGQAAAFDRATQNAFGKSLGQEFVQKGENVWLAPNVNMARYPLNGRTFEAYGEDPYLSGQTAAAGIQGIQSQHVIATPKHYLANNSETNRNYESSNIDERTMREIYLPAFETAVTQGGAGSVMCAYNRVNQLYACENHTVLTDVLKGDFGFKGFVMSDWFFAAHEVNAANDGLDMEMPYPFAFATLKDAVLLGVVPESRLNDMVYRIVFSMFRIGLFDNPVLTPIDNVSTPEHRALERKMAEDGTVLLKNAGSLLPLTGKDQTIAVIGDVGPDGAANVCSGGGSAAVDCSTSVPALDGIRARAAKNGDTVLFDDGSDPATAAATAARAKVAIVFGYYTESEGVNRSSLSLDGNGDELISSVAAANPKTVVVLETGGPATMPWLDNVSAVLEAWYPGTELGTAIAAVLFGDANPSGHLPITFPVSEADLPTAASPDRQNDFSPELNYSEKLEMGYRWYDAEGIEPLFPFGYGLSYTTFQFSGLTVTGNPRDGATVKFTVKNTGRRAGAEVAQVYVGFPSSAGEPPRQLKGFQRVVLGPGKSAKVTIALDRRAFSYWDPGFRTWLVAPGCYTVSVGDSSRSLPLSGQFC